MRITSMSLHNFKGSNRTIDFKRHNAVISGSNGCGKTTVADAWSWLLTGRLANGKSGVIRPISEEGEVDFNESVSVEAVIDDETVLCRELLPTVRTETVRYYINGVSATAAEFNGEIANYVSSDCLPAFCNLFGAMRLHWTVLRDMLIKAIGDVSNDDVFMTDPKFEDIRPYFETHESPQAVIDVLKTSIRHLKNNLDELPAKIEENNRIITKYDGLGNVADIQAEIDSLTEQFNEAIKKPPVRSLDEINADIILAQSKLFDISKRQRFIKESTPNTCPICGRKMKTDVWDDWYYEELSKIEREQSDAEAELTRYRLEWDDAQAVANTQDANELQSMILKANNRLMYVRHRNEAISRNNELTAQQQSLGKLLTKTEYCLTLARDFCLQQVKLIKLKIEEMFEFTSFKLYEVLKNNEVSPCCVPELSGVPFPMLSFGEKVLVATDVLANLQRYFGVNLPVFIDNAESFNDNYIATLDNQLIFLKTDPNSTFTLTLLEEVK